jgi:hypothetical protein
VPDAGLLAIPYPPIELLYAEAFGTSDGVYVIIHIIDDKDNPWLLEWKRNGGRSHWGWLGARIESPWPMLSPFDIMDVSSGAAYFYTERGPTQDEHPKFRVTLFDATGNPFKNPMLAELRSFSPYSPPALSSALWWAIAVTATFLLLGAIGIYRWRAKKADA